MLMSQAAQANAAAAELERRYRERAELGVVDFVPKVRPDYIRPGHLASYASVFDKVEKGPTRALVTAPPRHAKTETTLAGIARLLRRRPQTRIAYACYGLLVSWEKSKACHDFARRAGVRFPAGKQKTGLWRTEAGGCFYATGVGGSLTGLGFDLLVVDDPHKDRADAESPTKRRKAHDWYSSTAQTRLEPGGSAIVSHTRWHTDDLIGYLLRQDAQLPEERRRWGAPFSFPVFDAEDNVLWPERWPREAMLAKRDETAAYDWASLYMCSPRPRGESVFQNVYTYRTLPKGVRYGIGVDLAYSAKTRADYSVAVVLAEKDGEYFVVDVIRRQVAAPDFADVLKALQKKYGGAKAFSYAYGTEKGSVNFMQKHGVKIDYRQVSADKLTRALPVAAAWKARKVLLPDTSDDAPEDEEGALRAIKQSPEMGDSGWEKPDRFPWRGEFVEEVNAFTGVHDVNDDQVDALAAAYDLLEGSRRKKSGNGGSSGEWLGIHESPLNF